MQRLDLHNIKNSFIFAGDLNARRTDWYDYQDNQRGKFLRNWENDTLTKHKAEIYSTDEPSLTPAKTYLDVCITNLTISNLTNNNKITTADYDSDHRTLLFTVILPSINLINNSTQTSRRNIRATKWKKFAKAANTEYSQDLPEDRYLSIPEINDITEFTSALTIALNKTAPLIKKDEGLLKYLNNRIKNLQKNKSKPINLLHLVQKLEEVNKPEQIERLKTTISLIKSELRKEFNKSVDEY